MTHHAGRRVEIPAHTDTWMRGDRYGEIQGLDASRNGECVRVRLDKSGRVVSYPLDSLSFVD